MRGRNPRDRNKCRKTLALEDATVGRPHAPTAETSNLEEHHRRRRKKNVKLLNSFGARSSSLPSPPFLARTPLPSGPAFTTESRLVLVNLERRHCRLHPLGSPRLNQTQTQTRTRTQTHTSLSLCPPPPSFPPEHTEFSESLGATTPRPAPFLRPEIENNREPDDERNEQHQETGELKRKQRSAQFKRSCIPSATVVAAAPAGYDMAPSGSAGVCEREGEGERAGGGGGGGGADHQMRTSSAFDVARAGSTDAGDTQEKPTRHSEI